MSIEATRHQDPIWREAIDHRVSDLLESALYDISGGAPWQGDVDREADRVRTSDLFGSPCAREQGPLMG